MIKAVIFDFDDVIIKTEKLKALSYVKAIQTLCGRRFSSERIIMACSEISSKLSEESLLCPCPSKENISNIYHQAAGRSRKDMAREIVKQFGLEPYLMPIMKEKGLTQPWEALIALRMPFYEAMLNDVQMLRQSLWNANVKLLRFVKTQGFHTAIATMSEQKHVLRILKAVDLLQSFEIIVTGETVTRGKPELDIYLFTAHKLNLAPEQCLVVEDSLYGIQAAIKAEMKVIAVPTETTIKRILISGILQPRWIVTDKNKLIEVFKLLIKEIM